VLRLTKPARIIGSALLLASIGRPVVPAVDVPASGGGAAYTFLLAGALLADGDSAAALTAYAEAVALAPDDPYVHLEYANVLMRSGRFIEAAAEARLARQFAPGDTEVLRTQARIAMNLAERDPAARAEARGAFEQVLTAEPDDLESLVALGQIYLSEGEAKLARETLDRAAQLRPGQPMIESLRARALVESGDLSAAEAAQRSLLTANPDRLEVRLDLAELLSDRGRHREAADLLASATPSQQRSPELRRRRAIELYLDGDLKAASALATELNVEFPDNNAVRVLLATIEQADGNWGRVLELIEGSAVRAALQDQMSYLQVRALERLGRIEEALAALAERQKALEAAGSRGEALQVQASAALLAARNDRAAVALDLASRLIQAASARVPLDPAEAEIVLQMRILAADLEFERDDLPRAMSLLGEPAPAPAPADAPLAGKRYELAMRAGDAEGSARWRRQLEAGDLDHLLALAGAEERLERFAEALPVLEKALAVEPASNEIRFHQATVLERIGRIAESEALFEALIASEPDNAAALNYLGYMRIERGTEVGGGLELVRRALRIDANNGAYVDSLGWGLFKMGRLAEAAEVLERASRLMPNDATVLEHLGDSFRALGDLDRARDAYRRALALGPDSSGALAAKLAGLPGAS
jgi:tetratricopeptide (TPR) repeat protein